MAWKRTDRKLFDATAVATDALAAAMDEAPLGARFAKYATWANNPAPIASTSVGKRGLRVNSTLAKGSLPLQAQQPAGQALKGYGQVYLPASIATNAGQTLCALAVLAQDDNATPANARAVAAGLLMDAGATNRRWVIALVDNTNVVLSILASMPATSLGSGAGIARGYKVVVDAARKVVTLHQNTDGKITYDFTADIAAGLVLADWYGLALKSPNTVSATAVPIVESVDWFVNDPTYTPPNAAWDRTGLMPDLKSILEFYPGSEALVTAGATPTYDTDAVVGPQTLVQTPTAASTQRLEASLSTPLDLTGRYLVLSGNFDGPEQMKYTTTSLGADLVSGATTLTLSSATGITSPGAGEVHSVDVAGVSGAVFFNHRTGTVLTLVSPWSGATVTAGSKVSQHDGTYLGPVSVAIQLATDSAARTAGNYVEVRPLNTGLTGWRQPTFILKGALGWEGRTFGTPPNINNIGYFRITYTLSNYPLPLTTAPYDGPQDPTPANIKWDFLGHFAGVPRRGIALTFDDSFQSQNIAANEMEKSRPGMPNGVRGTFHTISSNVDSDSGTMTTRDLLRLAAAGHEISMHIHSKQHHASPIAGAGGDGPMGHYGAISPGGPTADLTTQTTYLKNLGFSGPFTWAWPYGEPCREASLASRTLGIVAGRSTSGGGIVPIVSGSGPTATCTGFDMSGASTRFLATPVGDADHLPGYGWDRDLNSGSGDLRGPEAIKRLILEACMQGGILTTYTHPVEESGVTPGFSGEWNRDMFADVLNYISDLILGTNTYGSNPNYDYYPDFKVMTLYEAINGSLVPQPTGMSGWFSG